MSSVRPPAVNELNGFSGPTVGKKLSTIATCDVPSTDTRRFAPVADKAPAPFVRSNHKFVEPTEPDKNDNVPLAVLRLEASARWVAERYPVRSTTELPDGGLEVVLPVATERWLARLLLRLGTRGSVVSPAEWEHLGADAAASVLARYERS